MGEMMKRGIVRWGSGLPISFFLVALGACNMILDNAAGELADDDGGDDGSGGSVSASGGTSSSSGGAEACPQYRCVASHDMAQLCEGTCLGTCSGFCFELDLYGNCASECGGDCEGTCITQYDASYECPNGGTVICETDVMWPTLDEGTEDSFPLSWTFDDDLEGWDLVASGGGMFTLIWDPTVGHDGQGSLFLNGDSQEAMVCVTFETSLSVFGRWFSAKVLAQNEPSDRVTLYWWGESIDVHAGGWQQIEFEIAVPGEDRVCFEVYGAAFGGTGYPPSPTAQIWIDDIVIGGDSPEVGLGGGGPW